MSLSADKEKTARGIHARVLCLIAVFIRDQIRAFPVWHHRLTEYLYADIIKHHPPVLSESESIERIVRDKVSVARFGDGEYKLCRNKSLRFQRHSKELAHRLRMILYCDVPNFYAAVVSPLLGGENHKWKNHFVHNYRIIVKLNDTPRLNSLVSFVEKPGDIDRMKSIWHNRKAALITNPQTMRMAESCGFFTNASALNFISVPNTETFSRYPSLLKEAKRQPDDTLFLLACGPTATVLAYNLHIAGYQAVDIGGFIRRAREKLADRAEKSAEHSVDVKNTLSQ